jgi:hypothetical protein
LNDARSFQEVVGARQICRLAHRGIEACHV